ncbi:hypothetical protein [Frigidibacter sp. MR17.24]|uniref:hypothetical protein n=1 Tax=Frigidibacter sp. MR17.24 TaxID=3127345 RepID=UPI0030130F32
MRPARPRPASRAARAGWREETGLLAALFSLLLLSTLAPLHQGSALSMLRAAGAGAAGGWTICTATGPATGPRPQAGAAPPGAPKGTDPADARARALACPVHAAASQLLPGGPGPGLPAAPARPAAAVAGRHRPRAPRPCRPRRRHRPRGPPARAPAIRPT